MDEQVHKTDLHTKSRSNTASEHANGRRQFEWNLIRDFLYEIRLGPDWQIRAWFFLLLQTGTVEVVVLLNSNLSLLFRVIWYYALRLDKLIGSGMW